MEQEKENKILKRVKWGFIALIALIGLYKCDSIIDSAKGLIKPPNSSIDTTEKIHTRDTIWAKDTIIIPDNKPLPKPRVIHDTIYKLASIDTLEMYRFFTYKDTVKDKNIDIFRDVVTQGKTLRVNKITGYKLKVPLTIIDSVKITVSKKDTIFKQPKYSFSIGAAVGTQLLCPTANVTIDRHTFGFGYNLQTKTPTIQYNFRIWSSKKR